jgi:methylmalonyl-CoA mutase
MVGRRIVTAAIRKTQGIASSCKRPRNVSNYLDLLRSRGGAGIKVFGCGGGVIVPSEIEELHSYGVARIYSPEDGARMGLQGMITDMIRTADRNLSAELPASLDEVFRGNLRELARVITGLESATLPEPLLQKLAKRAAEHDSVPVLGITGTGGSGKSSLTDELIRRFRIDQDDALKIAVIAVDPSRRKTGGALLGDRIRMNAINHPNIYMRSLATRDRSRDRLPAGDRRCKCAAST